MVETSGIVHVVHRMTTSPLNINRPVSHTDQQSREQIDAAAPNSLGHESLRQRLAGSNDKAQTMDKESGTHQPWGSYNYHESDSSTQTFSETSENERDYARNKLWRLKPDNVTQYCPSVSTISIIDSQDEGTRPYALKRIQRDFPGHWKHHPSGSAHNATNWHQHPLRTYYRGSIRDPGVSPVRTLRDHRQSSGRNMQAPKKRVRWADDPREAKERRRVRPYAVGRSPDGSRPAVQQPEERRVYRDSAVPTSMAFQQLNTPVPPRSSPLLVGQPVRTGSLTLRPAMRRESMNVQRDELSLDRNPASPVYEEPGDISFLKAPKTSAMAGLTGSVMPTSKDKVREWRLYVGPEVE